MSPGDVGKATAAVAKASARQWEVEEGMYLFVNMVLLLVVE